MLELIFASFFIVGVSNYTLITNFMSVFVIYLMLILYDSNIYIIKVSLILLSAWLIIMMILSVKLHEWSGMLLKIFIYIFLVFEVCFYSDSLLFFYLMFEMSVVPVFLIILGWGYQLNRIEASIYMIVYTVLFSLPLLIMIMYFNNVNVYSSFMSFLLFYLAFLVKLPKFGVHLWLPRAHVEAPVYGSMLLAGVMLKLGGYGIIKLSILLGDMVLKYNTWIIIYTILGSIYLSVLCFVQSDVKMLIAYSSVVHMGLVLSGLMTMREICLNSSMFMMVGHGLCSSGLFYGAGLIYNRLGTRSILLNKGLININPLISLFWFLMCSSNLSFPPCFSLVGEIGLMIGVISWNFNMWLLIVILSLVSSLYSIYLYSYTQHGDSTLIFSFKLLNLKELLMGGLHWLPLNILILSLKIMMW